IVPPITIIAAVGCSSDERWPPSRALPPRMAPSPRPRPITDALSISAPRAARAGGVAFGVDRVVFDQAAPVVVHARDDFLQRFLNEQLFAAHEADRGVRVRLDGFDQIRIDRRELAFDTGDADHELTPSK